MPNIVATVILFALLAVVAFLALLWSVFFAMASDWCQAAGGPCDTDWLAYANIVAGGGVGLALVGATVGTVVDSRRHRSTWVWPLMGTVVIVLTFLAGVALAGQIGSRPT